VGEPESILQILWSSDPMAQKAIGLVLGAAISAAFLLYGPLLVRVFRLFMLERRVRALLEERHDAHRDDDPMRDAILDSPVSDAFQEFEHRWATSQIAERQDHAPIRLSDVLDDRPLLPFGPRRSLLPVLPGLFLGLGVLTAMLGLVPSLSNFAASETIDPGHSAWIAAQLGLALRATIWGFLCAIGTSLTGRLIEGAFNARTVGLDALVEQTYGSVSPGELAEITRQTQQSNLDTLGRELGQFANELNERLDRGLQRIEQSTARSASLVSQEQRGALHTVVQELSVSVRQGVENHLAELRGALQRAIDHQTSVTGGIAETFERMVENSQIQDRVARTLVEAASSVEQAAQMMSGTSSEMAPVLEHLGSTSRALSDTADRIGDTQLVVARTAEGVRTSLEHAASGVDDQRQFIELSLGEIRRALVGLGDGLGDSLQRSLREVDDVLGSTVGQLRDTLAESNETIERLAGPIRAAEGSTHETHVALDRVRTEVEALGQWMTMAVKPIRTGLVDVDSRAEEMTRAITEFTNHTRHIDKTMETLREEIHDESRHLQGAGSELGRRLAQASDAIGLLESTTSDVARRARPDSKAGPRGRTWSPAPGAADFPMPIAPPLSSAEPETPETPPMSDEVWPRPPSPAEATASSLDEADSAVNASDPPPSGFRMGAPLAQGPDPYARMDAEAGAASNLRHFPTADRELGENLKLSDLLRPSSDASEPNEEAENSTPDEPSKTRTEDSE
jgi:methyl-accepting chemotaxis protein